jgi:hypothetical protein
MYHFIHSLYVIRLKYIYYLYWKMEYFYYQKIYMIILAILKLNFESFRSNWEIWTFILVSF